MFLVIYADSNLESKVIGKCVLCASSAACPQPQRSGVRLQDTPDRRRGLLPTPAALRSVALPAGAAGLHRLDPRHRSSHRSVFSHTQQRIPNRHRVEEKRRENAKVWKLLQMWWHEELAEGQFSSPPMVPMGSWWMELCGFFLCLFTFLTNLAVILLGSCFIYLFYLFFYVFLFIFVKIKRFFLSPNKQKQNNFLPDSL